MVAAWLSGCTKAVITTLSVDISQSNANNTENQKLIRDICKNITKKHIRSEDTLNLKEFDSEPSSGIKSSLKDSNQLERDKFAKDGGECDNLANSSSKPELCGTTIIPVWQKFYRGYKENKGSKTENSNNSIKETQVYIFFVDALEELSKQENCSEPLPPNSTRIKPSNNETLAFQASIKEFIEDDNFIIIFIKNSDDRRKMRKILEDALDLQKKGRIVIPDGIKSDDYKLEIEKIYKDAKG